MKSSEARKRNDTQAKRQTISVREDQPAVRTAQRSCDVLEPVGDEAMQAPRVNTAQLSFGGQSISFSGLGLDVEQRVNPN